MEESTDTCSCGCGRSLLQMEQRRKEYTTMLLARRNKEENVLYPRSSMKMLDKKYTMLAYYEEQWLHEGGGIVIETTPLVVDPATCHCGWKRKRHGEPPSNQDGWKELQRMRRKEREELAPTPGVFPFEIKKH